jgi:LPXTG-site transpeptidase (sortase) family protein
MPAPHQLTCADTNTNTMTKRHELLNSSRKARFTRTAAALLAAALLLTACGTSTGLDNAAAPTTAPSTAPTTATAMPADTDQSRHTQTTQGMRNTGTSSASAGKIQDPSKATSDADTPDTAPVRIGIPAINVDAPLEILSLDATNSLQPPVAWDAAGWYDRSPIPGERGPSVIAGHLTAPDGPAVFIDLGALTPGDLVTVTQADGSTDTFTVDRTISAERSDTFPTKEIYGPTPDAQLRLITCDGEYDPARGHWTRNMIVFATAIAQ